MGDELPDLELQQFSSKTSTSKEPEEKCVDSALWQLCAGSMVKMPASNSLVYYFPEGHAEHAQCSLDDHLLSQMNKPSFSHVLCRVNSLKLMADPQTDEVFAKIRLVPIKKDPSLNHLVEVEITRNADSPVEAVSVAFGKTLAPSDTEVEASFTVPDEIAETLFPTLNYKKDPPVQCICCLDVHGKWWKFIHIHSGFPDQRHLLSEGWSTFVRQKKLVAGDSIQFMKKNSGEILVGIRRKNSGPDNHRWASPSYDSTMRSQDSSSSSNSNNMLSRISSRRIRTESVLEAMMQAWSGQTFEVEYYPRAGTPEYCVKASLVRKAAMIQWWPGMIIKMAYECDDQSKINWGLGTIDAVIGEQNQWRRLAVSWGWEELKEALKDVKRVNPWMVELVSRTYMPSLSLLQFNAASFIPPPKSSIMGDELPDELRQFSSKTSKSKEPEEKCVDSALWQLCAGSMVKMPASNSLVYYFPEGHAEHAQYSLDDHLLSQMNKPPFSHVLCRVNSVKLMADSQTDEVFAKIHLVPIKNNPSLDHLLEEEITREDDSTVEAAFVFGTTLTPSDTGVTCFTVPDEIAETLFPPLNYRKKIRVHCIDCLDVHGKWWKFIHTHSGFPRRHLLSEGWSTFVTQKKLVAGDSLQFMKKNGGEILVGIRRNNSGRDNHPWAPPSYDSRTRFQHSNGNNMLSRISSRGIRTEPVLEAMRQAWSGQTFEVEYYPRAGTPEYCVKASLVRKAATIQWCPGMIIKMAVGSDDELKINWGLGMIDAVIGEQNQWRGLAVSWGLEELKEALKDVKRVNPWMVEPVSQGFRLDDYTSLSPLSNLNEHIPRFRFRDDEVGKDDTACVLALGVGHSSATASEQVSDVGTSGNDNDAVHDDALPQG